MNASGSYVSPELPTSSTSSLIYYDVTYQYNGTDGYLPQLLQVGLPVSGAVQNVALFLPGSITGTIGLGSAANLAGAGDVEVFTSSQAGVVPTTGGVLTDASGNFSLTGFTQPSSYYLYFEYLGTGPYQNTWWSDGPGITDKSVTLNGTALPHSVGTVIVDGLASIAGQVYLGSTSKPAGADDVTVTVKSVTTHAVVPGISANTDASGAFTLTGLKTDEYDLIYTYNRGKEYRGHVDTAGVVAYFQQPASVSTTLTAQYELSGHVNLGDASVSAGAGDVTVTIVAVTPTKSPTITTTTTTDADGNWSVWLLPATYEAVLHHDTVVGTYLDKGVPAPAGTACSGMYEAYFPCIRVKANTSTAPVTMDKANSISGTVTTDNGAPIASVSVHAESVDPTTLADLGDFSAETGADGKYSFGNLPAGQYAVDFTSPDHQYAFQAFDNESVYYYPNFFVLSGGASQANIDATMHPVATISGTVNPIGGTYADVAGDSLSAEVEVYNASTSSWVDTGDYYEVTFSAGVDRYTIPNLNPGSYRLRFDYFGRTGAHNNATFVSPPIVVTAGNTTTYNTAINVTGTDSTDSAIDSITGSTAGVNVAGWAVWPASDATSVGVAITVGSTKTSLTAHKASPEAVADEAPYEVIGPNHGFNSTIAVAPGTYNVCISVAEPTGPAASIGCSTVVVPAVRAAVVHQESVKGGVGSVTVKGWDVFPDSLSTQVAMSIHINAGKYNMTANKSDAEGTAAYPASVVSHGYKHTVTGLAAGTYSVCIWTSEPAGASINAGCHNATVTDASVSATRSK